MIKERGRNIMGYRTMDANEAVSRVSYKFTEIAGIYPITPASPMAEQVREKLISGVIKLK